jgi:hypothetical protein
MELIIRPIYPNPRDYPANLLPKIDSGIIAALNGPVKVRVRNAMADRTRNWKSPPSMGSRYHRPSKDIFELHVFPTGTEKAVKKWVYVSKGTRSHPISAIRAPMLKYQMGYKSHTKPSNKYGLPGGGSYSGEWRRAPRVQHPGVEARDFEGHVVEQVRKKVVADIQSAIYAALR